MNAQCDELLAIAKRLRLMLNFPRWKTAGEIELIAKECEAIAASMDAEPAIGWLIENKEGKWWTGADDIFTSTSLAAVRFPTRHSAENVLRWSFSIVTEHVRGLTVTEHMWLRNSPISSPENTDAKS